MDKDTIQMLGLFITAIISISSFARSGSNKSVEESHRNGKIEAKIDRLITDVEIIKQQNLESAKTNSQAEERFKTLFNWREDIEGRVKALER